MQIIIYANIIVLIKVLDVIIEQDEEEHWIWPARWQEIQQLLIFFKPFAEVTNYMSGQSYSTISSVIVQFNVIFDHLEFYTGSTPMMKSKKSNKSSKSKGPPAYIVNAAMAAHSKLREYYSKTNDMLCLITLLDPRCKKEYFYQNDFKQSQIQHYEER